MSKTSINLSEYFIFVKSKKFIRRGDDELEEAMSACNGCVFLPSAIKSVLDKELSLSCHCCSNHFLPESEPMTW